MSRYTLPLLTVTVSLVALAGCDATEPEPSRLYGDAEIDYFLEVALGSEFEQNAAVIRKWTQDVGIQVSGAPTAEDLETLDDVVADLNALIDPIEIRVLADREGDAKTEIIFAPSSEFGDLEPNYVPDNLGFFYVRWSSSCAMTSARILISTEGVTQQERSHLIREELTQTLGLMRDSYAYPTSIFYQDWTDVTEYAPIDETVIEMLYRPDIQPCMNQEIVRTRLSELPA